MMKRFINPVSIGIVVGLILIVPLWVLVGWYYDAGSRFWQWFAESFWGRGFWPNGWNIFGASDWTMIVAAFMVGLAAWYLWPRYREAGLEWGGARRGYVRVDEKHTGNKPAAYTAAGMSVLLLVSSIILAIASQDDLSNLYASQTRFVVADTAELNTNLRRLDSSYIEEGTYAQMWEPRVASATGAKTVMSRTSASDSGNRLLLETLSYTYGSTPGWTAVRDGKNKQPLYGVAFWPGQGSVSTCRFTGEYSITKALHGTMGNSLLDEVAAYNKSLFFDAEDMWGYCKPAGDPNSIEDDEPVIVIPVKTWSGYKNRAAWYSAGILVITGSSSGKAHIEHVKDATPGQFPGPVYSLSLAVTQREESAMMAGKFNKWWRDFGYETTDVKSQAGNSSEFLLKSEVDGHLYWVTPLTARSSDSQLVTAYSLIRADEAHSGAFNDLRIYVLANDDPRTVNLDDLEARTQQAISEKNPGFFSAGGNLVEFLPLNDTSWQVYAELGGRVVYRITVPSDSRIKPQVTSLEGIEEGAADTATPVADDSSSVCTGDLSQLSDAQLIQCLSDITDELERRQQP